MHDQNIYYASDCHCEARLVIGIHTGVRNEANIYLVTGYARYLRGREQLECGTLACRGVNSKRMRGRATRSISLEGVPCFVLYNPNFGIALAPEMLQDWKAVPF